ncbi:MAG: hypothetical protein M3N48_07635, partial [Verrucomicrobiota bacterium]|nr:hypothetical protein [Verrucomicrobiota bacterium]
AAGETPSPEMVAASGQKIGLKPFVAVSCLAAIVIGVVVFAVIAQRNNLLARIPFDNPPEVLTGKAREILQKLGYTDRPASSASGFEYRLGTINYLVHQVKGPLGPRLAKGRPPAIAFWFRSSPEILLPRSLNDIPLVTGEDPPEDVPGMLSVTLDPQGRLTRFTARPPESDPSKGPWPVPDWTILFSAAGLDPARFTPTEPQWAPPVMADARAAWAGAYPEAPEIPIRVEAAAFHGKPVNFVQVLTIASGPRSSPATGGKSTGSLVSLILQLVVLIGSIPFARYNMRLGRGDIQGALRLGLFVLCVNLSTWVIGGTHVASASEGDLFLMAAMRSVFNAASLAFVYISFEPFVRRKWPQTIVSWSRVLAGGFRDPLVGRDILLGTTMGVWMALVMGFSSIAYEIAGIPAVRVGTDPLTLLGGRYLAGAFLFLIVDVLYKSLGVLFLIFLCRTLLRKQWLAAGVIVITLSAIYATNAIHPFVGWPINLLFFSLAVFTLMRFGLLALAVAFFVSILLGQFPIGTDFSVWYSGEVAFTIVAIIALAVFSFRTALARQTLIKEN